LCRRLFALCGWRFEGHLPNVARAVVIVVPHTSNWDLVIGAIAMFALGLRVTFMGKHTLFWWPLGAVLRWLGGFPVDRSAASGVVDQIIDHFGREEQLFLVVAPEGTRGRVERWKSGFYRVAAGAQVPIAPVTIDYRVREIRFGPPIDPSGDMTSDLRRLRQFFADSTGKRDPEDASGGGGQG
jgi:1-acyl-sn-glycerol-3-phosphate acyltransferase